MGRFLRRNAIFFLFPAVVVAVVFLARINLSTALSFGEWGEKSIIESTLVLAKEKVERVEQAISAADHTFFRALDPAHLRSMCERWRAGVKLSGLVEAAAILDSEGEIVAYFHQEKKGVAQAKALYDLFVAEMIPRIDLYDSFYQHKHLHRDFSGEYRLITTFTREFEEELYTACIIYDTEEITNSLFGHLLVDVGKDRVLNVEDHAGRIIYGGSMDEAGQFIVVERFPSTLYKWRVQIAPKSAAFFSGRAKTKRFSQWALIASAFGVILFGLIVLYMAMVRERRLNRLKSEFVANASHELKTPLALIRMFSELLAMGKTRDQEKVRKYHEIIMRETERLTSLIDNVLDFSRIERGKSAYEFKITALSDVVEPAIEVYRHRIDNEGIELVFEAQKDLPLVNVDTDAVTLALINLMDNALKYAKGTDVIGVQISGDRKNVYLEVYDTGAGIPSHHLKRIFERFYRFQVGDLETRGHRGSGIGLSLVAHITKAHGGSVSVTSKPGVETRFTMKIPAVS